MRRETEKPLLRAVRPSHDNVLDLKRGLKARAATLEAVSSARTLLQRFPPASNLSARMPILARCMRFEPSLSCSSASFALLPHPYHPPQPVRRCQKWLSRCRASRCAPRPRAARAARASPRAGQSGSWIAVHARILLARADQGLFAEHQEDGSRALCFFVVCLRPLPLSHTPVPDPIRSPVKCMAKYGEQSRFVDLTVRGVARERERCV